MYQLSCLMLYTCTCYCWVVICYVDTPNIIWSESLYMTWGKGWGSFFPYGCSVPTILSFFHQIALTLLPKSKLTISVGVYFWTLYSLSLTCLSTLSQYHTILINNLSWVLISDTTNCPTLFMFKVVLAILSHFHLNFRLRFSTFYSNI